MRHYFSDTAVETQLSSGVSSSAATIAVASTVGFPSSFPYYLVIDQLNASMEVVRVNSAAVLVLTVDRGVSSTTAIAHNPAAAVKHVAAAEVFNTLSAHESSNANVHGVTAVAGLSETQTFTNKTISGAANTITNIVKANVAGAPIGAFVGDTDTQTLTNKTISGAANTLTNIPKASVVGAPTGVPVGDTDTQTLTNKTISGAANTFSNIPPSAIVGTVGAAPTVVTNNTPGTYSLANPGTHKYIHVKIVGGGGGGAGATEDATLARGGGGGGAGGFTEVWIPSGAATFPISYTVGAFGNGGAGATNGTAGGQSTFAGCTAPAGAGGVLGPTTPNNSTGAFSAGIGNQGGAGGGIGSVPVGSGYSTEGGHGGGVLYPTVVSGSTIFCQPAGGNGGTSYYGQGGTGISGAPNTHQDGNSAGSGGAGAGIAAIGSNTGGRGSTGQVQYEVYF